MLAQLTNTIWLLIFINHTGLRLKQRQERGKLLDTEPPKSQNRDSQPPKIHRGFAIDHWCWACQDIHILDEDCPILNAETPVDFWCVDCVTVHKSNAPCAPKSK